MPSTWIPERSFQLASSMVKGMNLVDVKDRILDAPQKLIWTAAPWRWTLGSLPETTLVANTQDYPITLPVDYFYTTQLWLTTGADATKQIEVVPTLPADVGTRGQVTRACIIEGTPTSTLRTYPRVGNVAANTEIYGIYKKLPPTITKNNCGTAGVLVMPDEWIQVYEAGVLYYAYLFADDQRAGGASSAGNGRSQYSGQLAVFMAMIDEMKKREPLPISDLRAGDVKDVD